MKRCFDLVISLFFFPIIFLMCLIIFLFLKIKLGSPVIFSQPRPGLNEEIFIMIKFRTMINKSDLDGNLLSDSERLTNFGKFLRSSSLDELPSFWNVIKGNMSLVGPRPLLVEYLPLYNSKQRRRHEVKPGISGWAQINGRNAITWDQKFDFDIWYVDNNSIWLDIKILLLTVKKVFIQDGINQSKHVIMPKFKGSHNAK